MRGYVKTVATHLEMAPRRKAVNAVSASGGGEEDRPESMCLDLSLSSKRVLSCSKTVYCTAKQEDKGNEAEDSRTAWALASGGCCSRAAVGAMPSLSGVAAVTVHAAAYEGLECPALQCKYCRTTCAGQHTCVVLVFLRWFHIYLDCWVHGEDEGDPKPVERPLDAPFSQQVQQPFGLPGPACLHASRQRIQGLYHQRHHKGQERLAGSSLDGPEKAPLAAMYTAFTRRRDLARSSIFASTRPAPVPAARTSKQLACCLRPKAAQLAEALAQ